LFAVASLALAPPPLLSALARLVLVGARWCVMLDGDPTTPTPPPPQTSIAPDALQQQQQQQQQQQRSYLHYVAHLPSVKATPVSQREQSLLSLVAVENEELARVNDQERVSFDTLSLLALRSAFVLPSGPFERRKRRKDKKRSSTSKKHTSKKVRNNVCWCVRSTCESPPARARPTI